MKDTKFNVPLFLFVNPYPSTICHLLCMSTANIQVHFRLDFLMEAHYEPQSGCYIVPGY